MSEPRRPPGAGSGQPQWSRPTEPLGNQYPPVDPAYADTYNYPGYVPPNTSDPTRVVPEYWTQTQYPQTPQQPETPSPPPKPPRWLWFAVGAAVVLVLGLVAALLIANSSERDETVVAPLPPLPDTATSETATSAPTATSTPSTTSPRPTTSSIPAPVPPPGTSAAPTGAAPTDSAATESVVYNVSGEGRAISITYVDTGGVLQMEFNVVLPWNRAVALSPSTVKAASVTVVNVGREVSCSVTVNGAEVQQRSGTGLTICASQR